MRVHAQHIRGDFLRKFYLQRNNDETGISGTGRVAEGIEFFPGGPASMNWNSEFTSIAFYRNMNDVEAIHGHNGGTVIVWEDEKENLTALSDYVTTVFRNFSR